MKYKIGEVSKILNISDQMIRYYEKCGVIKPDRSEGNYRYYTDMDVFLLFEAMKYKEWNINISDISNMISNDYYDQLIDRLTVFEHHLEEEISFKQILKERISWVKKRLKLCHYNTENVWVDILPAHYLYYMGESIKEDYDISTVDQEMSSLIYSTKYISFFDPYVEYKEDQGTWWYLIWKEFHDRLHLPDYGKFRSEPEQLVLMSVMDMGEAGAFDPSLYQPLLDYAKDHGYKTTGGVRGVIIGRGSRDQQFQRMMQIMLPIETL